MKKLIIGLVLVASLALLLVPVSCAREAPEEELLPPPPRPPMVILPEEGGMAPSAPDKAPSTIFVPITEERMIVRTGDMFLVVESVSEALEDITQLAVGFGGYVVSSHVSGEEERMMGWITIRVPDEKFDQALAELRDLAVRVEEESTNSQDVTMEYTDLESRLKNAEATEQQYLALLEKAEDVEDILKIYDYLSRIRQEIEQIKGQMQYLERTSSMSLISVYLEPEFTAKPPVPPGWNALEVFKTAARGLVITGQVLGTIAIWLIIFIPIWGTVLGILLWRRHKRKMRG